MDGSLSVCLRFPRFDLGFFGRALGGDHDRHDDKIEGSVIVVVDDRHPTSARRSIVEFRM